MHARFIRSLAILLALALPLRADDDSRGAGSVKPLKVLLITGGCCHDYARQKDLLKEGIEARAHAEIVSVHTDDKTTGARFSIYKKPDWTNGYDAVIHDECTSEVKDMPYVENILNAHKRGVPAVLLHCAMHSYRVESPIWFEFCGIQSSRHGPRKPIDIHFLDKNDPITGVFQDWRTVDEELYNNIKVFDTATPLARGKQDTGKEVNEYVVVWTNQYGRTPVFATTLGHTNETVGDARYLDLVTRGLLWSCGKLDRAYLKSAPSR